MGIWVGLLALVTSLWVLAAVRSMIGLRTIPILEDMAWSAPSSWPKVSVIVPALNEEATIEAALRSLLASTYPNLEIVAINDRSTDGTGAIIDRLAKEDLRLHAVHVESLPEGWLGKVHALHRGTEAATGEWLLLTDADVHFAKGALERAVGSAEHQSLDHLAVFPRFIAHGIALKAALSSFFVTFGLAVQPHRVRDPSSKAAVGVGAFNLVRRRVLDRSLGLPWLKMEVADDVGLGLMLKQSGARAACAMASGLLKIEWYPSVSELIHGLEKNSFGVVSRYRWSRFIFSLLVILVFLLAPMMLIIAAPGAPWTWALAAIALLSSMTAHADAARLAGFSPRDGLLGPLVGNLIMLWILTRSAGAFFRQGGIRWRGTLYRARELREGLRVEI